MTDTDLMPIGTFAKAAGLTASALRFYDDAGVLRPDQIDAHTGYRFYSDEQILPGQQLRQLRDIGMPLSDVARFFAADAGQARRLLDEHMAGVAAETAEMHDTAVRLRASLGAEASTSLCSLPGPMFAAAVEQILAATTHDPDFPVLDAVRLTVSPDAITLAATDRYRFATRTLVPHRPSAESWEGTVAGSDLRDAVSTLRRSPTVTLESGDGTLHIRLADDTAVHCRLVSDAFPEVENLMASLPAVSHRCTVERRQFLTALERQPLERVGVRAAPHGLQVLLMDDVVELDSTVEGPAPTLWFELTTLYPALAHALGDDLLLDLRGPDQPVVLRSADDGDFTTVLMPCRAPAD